MRYIYLITIMLLGNCVSAQMLDTRKPLFRDDPFFNDAFIAQNEIKRIHGIVSTKREMEVIKKSDREVWYEFDKSGKLTKQVSVEIKLGKNKDTTYTYYEYFPNGLLKCKRSSDVDGFFSYNFAYDDKGRITQRSYARDINVGTGKNSFKLGKQIVITKERYTYEKIDKLQIKKFYYNNLDRVYKEEIIQKDKYGYLTGANARFVIGNHRHYITYTYNKDGRLERKTEVVRMFNSEDKEYTYVYDEVGNLSEQNMYKDTKHLTVKQFLLDKKTYLIEAQLIKDVPSNIITIIQYDYQFFDE